MADTCVNCGKKIGYGKGVRIENQPVCVECEKEYRERTGKRKEIMEKGVKDIVITTTPAIEDKKIEEYLGVVSARAIMGVDIIADWMSSFRDAFGGRAGTLQRHMRISEETALQELKVEAAMLGGNAVVGISMDSELIETKSGGKMVITAVHGTAVVAE